MIRRVACAWRADDELAHRNREFAAWLLTLWTFEPRPSFSSHPYLPGQLADSFDGDAPFLEPLTLSWPLKVPLFSADGQVRQLVFVGGVDVALVLVVLREGLVQPRIVTAAPAAPTPRTFNRLRREAESARLRLSASIRS